MAATIQPSWKDRALSRSEVITDAWEVTKAYAGRLAEWILYLCMIMNVIEILPSVNISIMWQNIILGVQAVTLDIGGFSLTSMAEHAKANGNEQAATKARRTGYLLISVMMLTLLLVTVGILYPPAKQWTDGAEKFLILIRMLMAVVYGHVVHGLRSSSEARIMPIAQHEDKVAELLAGFHRQLQAMTQTHALQLQQQSEKHSDQVQQLHTRLEEIGSLLVSQIAAKTEPTSEPENENIVDMQEYRVFQENEPGDETDDETIGTSEGNTREPRVHIVSQPKGETTREPKNETSSTRGTAQQKALRILKRYPNITAPELAKKAQITTQYASRILKKRSV